MRTKKACMGRAAGWLTMALMLMATALTPAPARAAQEGWEINVAPYLWAIGIDADVGVGGVTGNVDMNFGDIVDQMDMAFLGYIEASHRPWSLYLDYTYLDVSDSGYTRISKIDYNTQTSILEIGGAYQFLRDKLGQTGAEITADVLLAGRAFKMDSEIKFPRLGNYSDDQSWVDPVMGLRVHLLFAQSWFIKARADIGGFGVASDLTYKLQAILGYQFTPAVGAFIGFRDLYVDYSEGEGRDEFIYKGHIYGPLMGVIFTF